VQRGGADRQDDVGIPDPVETTVASSARPPSHTPRNAPTWWTSITTEKRREALVAEAPGDQARGRRQRRHVGEAHPDGEGEHVELGLRKREESRDADRAQRVERDQQALRRHPLDRCAGGEAASHIARTDDCEPHARHRRRQSAQVDLARHVRHQECHVEAADEEAAGYQPEARRNQCVAHAGHGRCVRRRRGGRRHCGALALEDARERQRQQRERREAPHRRDPTRGGDRRLHGRREYQLANRCAGADDPGGQTPPLGRCVAVHHRKQQSAAAHRRAGAGEQRERAEKT
jgi:hypothetical protein